MTREEFLDAWASIAGKPPNSEQLAIMDHAQGPLQITAGPGVGKTYALILRVLFLLCVCQVPPSAIVLTTFTRKATEELRLRLQEALSRLRTKFPELRAIDLSHMRLGTLHSLCWDILTHGIRNEILEEVEKGEEICHIKRKEKRKEIPEEEAVMSRITSSAVTIQTSPQSVPSTPSWMGEVAVVAQYLSSLGLLEKMVLEVRFSRKRFGIYDTIDFICVLIGYTLSGEATLKGFYERLRPFATPFMALFGRSKLPSRGALSRFLAALDQPAVETLRALFQKDLVARPLIEQGEATGGLWDRCGERWYVFDADGTRQVARQRALPATPDLPPAHRRMTAVCAPGYTGHKRGEVVRTRTIILQAHTHQWMGTFGNPGNGDYRGDLLRAVAVITGYLTSQHIPLHQAILRLDGQYGDYAVVADLDTSGLPYVTRGKDYGLLDHPEIQARLERPPDQVVTHPETATTRALFDCLDIALTLMGPRIRVIVATHPATSTPARVGTTRDGVVYELFFTCLPPSAFTPLDVLDLYLHRGGFETVLSDEDKEQDFDRWCSYTANGQEFWQILSQWIWNLRLELGHHLHPTPMRLTEFATAEAAPHTPSASEEPPPPQ